MTETRTRPQERHIIVNVYVTEIKMRSETFWAVRVENNLSIRTYVSQREANENAVFEALETVSRRVVRGEIDVSEGLGIQVVIKRDTP